MPQRLLFDSQRGEIPVPVPAAAPGANGLFPTTLRFADFKNLDGSALAAAASAGKFGQTVTLGTAQRLVSEAANSNTKTDDAVVEYILPQAYIAGQGVTATVNASITGAGTLTTKTAQIKAYRVAADGSMGADIGPGAGVAITAGGADIPFAIAGATLNPGDKLLLEIETVLTETAASNMVANINSVRIS
jgi:hypothetical protein